MIKKAINQVESPTSTTFEIQMGESNFKTYTLKSASFTAESNEAYLVDTTNESFEILLPINPASGDVISIADARGTWSNHPITILRNGKKIEGSEFSFTNNSQGSFFSLVYVDLQTGWKILSSGTKPINVSPPVINGDYNFTVTNGVWTGTPTNYAYQWQISEDGITGWVNIEGATNSSYSAISTDEGKYIRCLVVATNSNGPSLPSYSLASGLINLPDIPMSGLLAFWKLDSVTDSSGNENTLTNNNSVTFSSGKIGNAANVGPGVYLSRTMVVPSSSNFSVSAWFKETVHLNNASFVAAENLGGKWWFWTDGTYVYFTPTSYDDSLGGAYSMNTWTHVIASISNGTLSLYVNGSLIGTGAWSATNSAQVRIGLDISNQAFTGMVDAVGIWNRALTTEEVAQVYNNGNGVEI